MRPTLLAAATLCLAAPAIAQQPDPDSLGQAVMQQILANQGDVRDYTLVLAHGPMRIPAYLHRDGDLWIARLPEDHPMAAVLSMAVQMPVMASEVMHGDDDVSGMEAEARYDGIEDVGGRRAHVVWGTFSESGTLPDTLHLYVDVETGQLLRIAFTGQMGDDEGSAAPLGGGLRMVVDLADYTTRDGLTLPRRTRMRMSGDLGLSPQELEEARAGLVLAREEMETLEEEVAAQVGVVMEWMEGLLLRGEMDMTVQVEDVEVNSGPPAWLEDGEDP